MVAVRFLENRHRIGERTAAVEGSPQMRPIFKVRSGIRLLGSDAA